MSHFYRYFWTCVCLSMVFEVASSVETDVRWLIWGAHGAQAAAAEFTCFTTGNSAPRFAEWESSQASRDPFVCTAQRKIPPRCRPHIFPLINSYVDKRQMSLPWLTRHHWQRLTQVTRGWPNFRSTYSLGFALQTASSLEQFWLLNSRCASQNRIVF